MLIYMYVVVTVAILAQARMRWLESLRARAHFLTVEEEGNFNKVEEWCWRVVEVMTVCFPATLYKDDQVYKRATIVWEKPKDPVLGHFSFQDNKETQAHKLRIALRVHGYNLSDDAKVSRPYLHAPGQKVRAKKMTVLELLDVDVDPDDVNAVYYVRDEKAANDYMVVDLVSASPHWTNIVAVELGYLRAREALFGDYLARHVISPYSGSDSDSDSGSDTDSDSVEDGGEAVA
jgi:hypothetical protein